MSSPLPQPETVPPHVLVVDDDEPTRRMIYEYLGENDMRVSMAENGAEMMRVLEQHPTDLILLDLRLGREDGMQIARHLREHSAVPIIILTGRLDEADRVMGLELGADDYVTKPFSPRELLARIRTVLRRSRTTADGGGDRRERRRAYRFGPWELNLRNRRLTGANGKPVELTNGEFNLLAAFLGSPQRVLTREQLIEMTHVHDDEVYDRAIDVLILRLRRKIEKNPSQPEFIKAERGAGYIFAAPVEVL